MDRLDRMQLFVRVVERSSFTAAAADLRLARSTVTEAIKQMEADLCVRLLERTTRHVRPTLDGQAFYERCRAILADVDDAENVLRNPKPRGLLRIDANVRMTRSFILPRLPEFLALYPEVDIQFGQGDRLVDLVREGVDCAIRAGELADSGMIVKRLTLLQEVTCASPAYLAEHGTPQTPDDLSGHLVAGFVSSRTGAVLPLEFTVEGHVREVQLPSRVTANHSDTVHDLARLGLGLIQAPRYRLQPDIEAGRLVEILKDYPPSPTPLSVLYPQNRQMPPRLRVFLNWLSQIFSEARV
jgi:DNA-binding transcriptional LysR family regulator